MSEFREQLIDRIVQIYGLEHEVVIGFAQMCETYPIGKDYDRKLEVLVESYELATRSYDDYDEEDEE